MADRLARIYGTEEDRVNCPFFFKTGACRHGERCSRMHNRPVFSQTLLFPHLYDNPYSKALQMGDPHPPDPIHSPHPEFEKHTLQFFADMFNQFAKIGEVQDMIMVENLTDHLVGNVYVKYEMEEDAQAAMDAFEGKWFNGKPVWPEFSNVTDFRDARCRQFDEMKCTRENFCNFMHVKKIPSDLVEYLLKTQPHYKEAAETMKAEREEREKPHVERRSRSASRSRSKSPSSHSRSRSASSSGSRSRSRSRGRHGRR